MTGAHRIPLYFVGSSLRDLQGMPEDVKDVFGSGLLDAQYGEVPEGARRFGEGLPSQIMKLVEDHDGDTYRAAYTVASTMLFTCSTFSRRRRRRASVRQSM